jgi:hypothetical protein
VRTRKNNTIYYGSRKSDKLIRGYEKPEVGSYRVEVELHSGLLRRHRIVGLDDLVRLPEVLCPKHFQFVDFDWNRLKKHLARKLGGKSDSMLAGARRRRTSILRLQRYLRRKGVFNTHRFLLPRATNKDVVQALKRWARGFDNEEP